jgi:hypothetical protein
MPKPLPAEARPGSASCHVATVSHDSSNSAMRCVRPPLKLYSTAAPAAVGVCRHTPSVQYLAPAHTAVLYTVYSLRACTRHTRTRPYCGSRSPNNENFSIKQCDRCCNVACTCACCQSSNELIGFLLSPRNCLFIQKKGAIPGSGNLRLREIAIPRRTRVLYYNEAKGRMTRVPSFA